jgi:hypothetical protein
MSIDDIEIGEIVSSASIWTVLSARYTSRRVHNKLMDVYNLRSTKVVHVFKCQYRFAVLVDSGCILVRYVDF